MTFKLCSLCTILHFTKGKVKKKNHHKVINEDEFNSFFKMFHAVSKVVFYIIYFYPLT